AICRLLEQEKYQDLSYLSLYDSEVKTLDKIRQFLEIPHAFQELVSAEQTPTLTVALPAYEQLLTMFKLFKNNSLNSSITHAIDASIEKLETYLVKTRNTRVYAIALMLNLTIKLKWLEENWSPAEVNKAKNWLCQSMLEYQKATQTNAQSNPTPGWHIMRTSSASNTACAQRASLSQVMSMMHSLSAPNLSEPPANELLSGPVELTEQEHEAAQDLEDERVVDTELQKYFGKALITDEEEIAGLDISKKHTFRLIYQVSLDVLPVQASSVPSNLSPEMMEMLQVLKYTFKAERLDFNDEWVARKDELSVVDITSEEFDHLIATGQLEELSRLIALSSSQ
ncbi:hypothetical protein H0H81_004579, partial [Sphagnurus paluster]